MCVCLFVLKQQEMVRHFTFANLHDKAQKGLFGWDMKEEKERVLVVIPHTVTLEFENLKNKSSISRGDKWRVQKLTGANGIIEQAIAAGIVQRLQPMEGG